MSGINTINVGSESMLKREAKHLFDNVGAKSRIRVMMNATSPEAVTVTIRDRVRAEKVAAGMSHKDASNYWPTIHEYRRVRLGKTLLNRIGIDRS